MAETVILLVLAVQAVMVDYLLEVGVAVQTLVLLLAA
jgi:hypothetical protein